MASYQDMYIKKQRTRTNDTWFIFYLLILRTIVGSFMIFQLGNTKFFVSLFIFGIAILLGKKEIKEES